ncbi:MAG: tail fiber domain-containing protein [bacterium]|nr:tail fiber domain-containing protein [bacterium]
MTRAHSIFGSLAAIVLSMAVCGTALSQTAVPLLVNYQGELRSPTTGEPLLDGSYNMVFRIFDAEPGGAALWQGVHSDINGNPVQVKNGIFGAILGSGSGNAMDASLFSGADRWLEIRVGMETLSPRQRIASAAYSMISENSRLLAGREAAQFANSTHAHSGGEITSGTVSEARIDPLIARDTETNAAVGAHQGITDAHHTKTRSFTELTDLAADAQIPASIARDSEVIPTVLAGDGAGSTLDADYLDGNDSSAFALSEHAHDARYWSLTGNTGTDPATHFLGTADNQAVEVRVNRARALRLEPNATSPNLIAGYGGNAVSDGVAGATVGGGGAGSSPNTVTDNFGTVGGGEGNQAGDNAGTADDARESTVGGGSGNTASGAYATVAGGYSNEASREGATVGAGSNNAASGDYATVAGGRSNQANASYATIAGGGPWDPDNPLTSRNLVTDDYGTVGGGGGNQAGNSAGTTTDAQYATVAGGMNNAASNDNATVAGGMNNAASGYSATVAGGDYNGASGNRAIVGGGSSNTASGNFATVAGGTNNAASDWYATVAGGDSNEASDWYATVGGGSSNTASGNFATVGGGSSNQANASYATIAGGGPSDPDNPDTTRNLVTDDYGTIAGGGHNQAGDNAGTTGDRTFATVGGGNGNTASGGSATVAGGYNNTAGGSYATVAGGYSNETSARYAAVAGGYNNTAAGDYSFAAGRRAKANHDGAFVWGDSQLADIASTADNQVTFRCLGGVRFLSGAGGANQMVSWAPANASWTFSSDRNLKENFVEIDPKEVLERLSRLPVTEWNFKRYSQRHIGPVAQDFHALFPLGGSETMIDSGDLQGVALAAIQGLHEMLREKDEKISTLEARVEALETLVEKLVESQAGGEE